MSPAALAHSRFAETLHTVAAQFPLPHELPNRQPHGDPAQLCAQSRALQGCAFLRYAYCLGATELDDLLLFLPQAEEAEDVVRLLSVRMDAPLLRRLWCIAQFHPQNPSFLTALRLLLSQLSPALSARPESRALLRLAAGRTEDFLREAEGTDFLAPLLEAQGVLLHSPLAQKLAQLFFLHCPPIGFSLNPALFLEAVAQAEPAIWVALTDRYLSALAQIGPVEGVEAALLARWRDSPEGTQLIPSHQAQLRHLSRRAALLQYFGTREKAAHLLRWDSYLRAVLTFSPALWLQFDSFSILVPENTADAFYLLRGTAEKEMLQAVRQGNLPPLPADLPNARACLVEGCDGEQLRLDLDPFGALFTKDLLELLLTA